MAKCYKDEHGDRRQEYKTKVLLNYKVANVTAYVTACVQYTNNNQQLQTKGTKYTEVTN